MMRLYIDYFVIVILNFQNNKEIQKKGEKYFFSF